MKLSVKLLIGFLVIALTASVSGIVGFNGVSTIIEIEKFLHTQNLEDEVIEEIMEGQIDKIGGTIVFSSTLGLITAIGLGLYFSTLIAIPLKKLELAAKRVGKGDLDVKIDHKKSDEIGEFVETFNHMTDSIKKVIELEKDLAVSQQKVQHERLTSIGELSARIAHDIRNPLGVIRTTHDNLEKLKDDPESFTRAIKRADRAISRISHQIEGVMDFLKDSPLKLELIPFTDFIQSQISSMVIPDGIKVIPPANNISFLGDTIKLQSLFYNLILNAIQSMNNDGTITIRASIESNDVIKIEVENYGPAISDENITKIFDPLFTTKQSGTGLGLASCKKIVDQHNGTISVTNNPTIFTVLFPFLKHSD